MASDISRLDAHAASEEGGDTVDHPSEESGAIAAPAGGDDVVEDVPGSEGPIPRRQVVIIPGAYQINEEVMRTEAGEFVELGFGNPVYGGQLYFNRSQLVEIGSKMLQLAGQMIPPKVLQRLQVVEQDKVLVAPNGQPLTSPEG